MRTGINYTQARGLTEMTEALTANTLDALEETGEHEQALALATELAAALSASGNLIDLTAARAVQVRILTLRGQASGVADTLDWLETTSRESGNIDIIVAGLGSTAIARAALAQPDHATALLAEIDAIPGSRRNGNYPALLPALVRAALASGNPQLAHQLTTGSNPTPPTTNTPSPPPPPPSAKPTTTWRKPPTATPTPPTAGKPSASSPSKPSPCSAKAAASSHSAT